MPDNSIIQPIVPPQGPDHNPIGIQQNGTGAFVLLDYSTTNNTDRNEHCVVFLPDSWGSLHELMRAPAAFMDNVLRAYTEVKDVTGSKVTQWPFAAPITIHIEPLTSPSPTNIAMLTALSGLYPLFKNALEHINDESFSLSTFRQLVIDGAKVKASPAELQKLADRHRSMLKSMVQTNGSSGQSQNQGTSGGPSSGPGGWIAEDFEEPALLPNLTELYFVIEYALNTRVLSVKYIPQPPRASTDTNRRYFYRRLTDVTVNPVGLTAAQFIHFDMEFEPGERTHMLVAEERANLAMEYLEHPALLNHIVGAAAVHLGTTQKLTYHLLSADLTTTGHELKQKDKLGNPAGPVFTIPAGFDPTVILDSVLPDPSNLPTGVYDPTNVPQGTDPVAPPCTVVYYVNGVPYYIIIKNYG